MCCYTNIKYGVKWHHSKLEGPNCGNHLSYCIWWRVKHEAWNIAHINLTNPDLSNTYSPLICEFWHMLTAPIREVKVRNTSVALCCFQRVALPETMKPCCSRWNRFPSPSPSFLPSLLLPLASVWLCCFTSQCCCRNLWSSEHPEWVMSGRAELWLCTRSFGPSSCASYTLITSPRGSCHTRIVCNINLVQFTVNCCYLSTSGLCDSLHFIFTWRNKWWSTRVGQQHRSASVCCMKMSQFETDGSSVTNHSKAPGGRCLTVLWFDWELQSAPVITPACVSLR